MRWPNIFFKSRSPKLPAPPPRDTPSKPASKIPTISELEKSVEPSPVKAAADKTAVESLRALTQSDTIRIIPPGTKEGSSPSAKTTDLPSTPAGPNEADTAHAGTSSFRRRAKMTDVARILPEGEEPLPKAAPESASTTPPSEPEAPAAVVPAAFSVAVATGSVMEKKAEDSAGSSPAVDLDRPDETPPQTETSFDKKEVPLPDEPKPARPSPGIPSSGEQAPAAVNMGVPLKDTTRVIIPELTATPSQTASPNAEIEPAKSDTREKREFVLANGERILGHILSETAEAIYLDHHTLGVLTLPRAQIAKKPIEVILINGDRVVGDLIAETTECLYIRHASLGMLTVPHNQRSTRVVEAILKDGDRILGEVLAETDHFTVIRSATLGTVAVQHEQVAMLNRKIEQMQLRALPAPALDAPKRD